MCRMYVCLSFVCMYVYVHVCMYVSTCCMCVCVSFWCADVSVCRLCMYCITIHIPKLYFLCVCIHMSKHTNTYIYIYARYKRIHTHIYTLKAIRTTRAHRQQLPVVHCVDAYSKASHAEPSVEVEGRLIRNGYGNI